MRKDIVQGAIDLFEQAGLERVSLSAREKKYFANHDFQSRVTEGVKRVADKGAESSFIVGKLRRINTVFPLVYGTASEELEEGGMSMVSMTGFNGYHSAHVDIHPNEHDINKLLRKREGKNFQSFDDDELPILTDGEFHFHTLTSGFSEKDIENYDKSRSDALIPKKIEMSSFLSTNGCIKGLFFPIHKKHFMGKVTIVELGYLALSGNPNSTEYQSSDLYRLSPPGQVKLFRRCGFDVSHAVIPLRGGIPQFQAVTR